MKKLISLITVVFIFIGFSSCTKNRRIDYSELSRRIVSSDKKFALNEDEMFLYNGIWYLGYSFFSENDMLLTLKEDNGGFLCEITLTVAPSENEELLKVFKNFSKAVISAFIPRQDGEIDFSELFPEDESLFEDVKRQDTAGNYTVKRVSSPECCVFMCRIY